jgi:hypothetical protein
LLGRGVGGGHLVVDAGCEPRYGLPVWSCEKPGLYGGTGMAEAIPVEVLRVWLTWIRRRRNLALFGGVAVGAELYWINGPREWTSTSWAYFVNIVICACLAGYLCVAVWLNGSVKQIQEAIAWAEAGHAGPSSPVPEQPQPKWLDVLAALGPVATLVVGLRAGK